ncbi:hypothetical protein Sjap_005084 [Stephania japonica]|uniref:Uncharacterized protein n=1 Tax=Stephania japonica TaxID=461633 RepID=A0AAP0PLI0_9MAGN
MGGRRRQRWLEKELTRVERRRAERSGNDNDGRAEHGRRALTGAEATMAEQNGAEAIMAEWSGAEATMAERTEAVTTMAERRRRWQTGAEATMAERTGAKATMAEQRCLLRGSAVPPPLREVVARQGKRRGVGERTIAERERGRERYLNSSGGVSLATTGLVGGQRVSDKVNGGEEEKEGSVGREAER